MRKILYPEYYLLIILWVVWFVSCGPSMEERRAAASRQPVECNVRVIFSNGHVDTLHVIYTGELEISNEGNLVDNKGGGYCCDEKVIAKGVSYFGIVNTE